MWRGVFHANIKQVEKTHPVGLLQPLPIPEQKWESFSMDFITKLPKVQGKDNIYVLVYRLTKFVHFFAVTSTISSSEVATLFFKDVFRLHGLPNTIISGWDIKFSSSFWKSLFELVGKNMKMRTGYHPHTDGQTKRVNQCIEGYVHNYVTVQQKSWATWFHLGELCYNVAFHLSIRMTPFMDLYGYETPYFVDLMLGDYRAQKSKY